MTGRFITIEGIEGAGKSTAMSLIQRLITDHGRDVLATREPGGTALGEALRALLLGHKHTDMASDAELLLMFAARAQHLQEKILPALAAGQWVLCDRFTDASYAYQGGGRELDHQRIAELERFVQHGRKPDLTILLDLPVELGLERAGRRSTPDRFESEQRPFFERVRSAYLAIAAAEPERVKWVDASVELDQVGQAITDVIQGFIENHD